VFFKLGVILILLDTFIINIQTHCMLTVASFSSHNMLVKIDFNLIDFERGNQSD
jgi:hypothetical protein